MKHANNNDVLYRLDKGVIDQKSKQLSRRTIILAVICSTLIVVGIFAILSAPSVGSPAVKSTTSLAPKSTIATPKIETTAANTIRNKYYELRLPNNYRSQSVGPGTSGALYQETIVKASAGGSQLIVISIFPLPSGDLQELSAYQLRSSSQTQYKKTQRTIKSEPVVAYSDTTSASVVLFWKHNGYAATIAASSAIQDVSSNGNQAQLEALQPLLDSWQWQ